MFLSVFTSVSINRLSPRGFAVRRWHLSDCLLRNINFRIEAIVRHKKESEKTLRLWFLLSLDVHWYYESRGQIKYIQTELFYINVEFNCYCGSKAYYMKYFYASNNPPVEQEIFLYCLPVFLFYIWYLKCASCWPCIL